MISYTIIGIFVVYIATLEAALSVSGKHCGSKICDLLEYCSNIHNQCETCETVCDNVSHNFDQEICTSQCQNYLFEQRFLQTSQYADEINLIRRQQTIILVIVIVLLACFAFVHGIYCIRWLRKKDYMSIDCIKFACGKRKKNVNINVNDGLTHYNTDTQSPKLKNRRIAGPNVAGRTNGDAPVINTKAPSTIYSISGVGGSTVHTMSTPISRYPAEDSTLDFIYDNEALQVTPTSDNKPKSETTF